MPQYPAGIRPNAKGGELDSKSDCARFDSSGACENSNRIDMAELGYTWYPQNWRSSDSVFELSLAEKGLYREIIDQAYMENNRVVYNPNLWARRHGATVSEIKEIVEKLAGMKSAKGEPLIVLTGEIITVPSCEKRLAIRATNQENGKKGGRPPKGENRKITETITESKPKSKPNQNRGVIKTETQPERQIEIERERETKIESKTSTDVDEEKSAGVHVPEFVKEDQKRIVQPKENEKFDWNLWQEKVEGDQSMIETCCMQNKMGAAQFLDYLSAFVLEKTAVNYRPRSDMDLRMHLLNWIRIRVAKVREEEAKGEQKGKITQGKETINRAAELVKQRLKQGFYADDSY